MAPRPARMNPTPVSMVASQHIRVSRRTTSIRVEADLCSSLTPAILIATTHPEAPPLEIITVRRSSSMILRTTSPPITRKPMLNRARSNLLYQDTTPKHMRARPNLIMANSNTIPRPTRRPLRERMALQPQRRMVIRRPCTQDPLSPPRKPHMANRHLKLTVRTNSTTLNYQAILMEVMASPLCLPRDQQRTILPLRLARKSACPTRLRPSLMDGLTPKASVLPQGLCAMNIVAPR